MKTVRFKMTARLIFLTVIIVCGLSSDPAYARDQAGFTLPYTYYDVRKMADGGLGLTDYYSLVTTLSNFWQQQTNGLYGGVVSHLAINSNGDIFSGTYGAGVFRSSDNGETWTQINNGLPDTYVNCLAISPITDTIFAETHRSTDNGETWVNTGLPDYPTALGINSSGYVFAATFSGIFIVVPMMEKPGHRLPVVLQMNGFPH